MNESSTIFAAISDSEAVGPARLARFRASGSGTEADPLRAVLLLTHTGWPEDPGGPEPSKAEEVLTAMENAVRAIPPAEGDADALADALAPADARARDLDLCASGAVLLAAGHRIWIAAVGHVSAIRVTPAGAFHVVEPTFDTRLQTARPVLSSSLGIAFSTERVQRTAIEIGSGERVAIVLGGDFAGKLEAGSAAQVGVEAALHEILAGATLRLPLAALIQLP